MIKTITKRHPWRDIILDFDHAIQPPAFETEALTLYYEAHDKTWAIKQHADERLAKLARAEEIMQDLYLRRMGLEQELDLLEEALQLKEQDPDLRIDAELTIDVNGFFEAGQRHSQDLQELYLMIDGLTNTYNNDLDQVYEDDCVIDPKYFEIFDDIWARYEELSVHTVSLDDDYQSFLESHGVVEKLFFDYIERAQRVFEDYAQMVPHCNTLYRRIERAQLSFNDKISGLNFPE